MTAAQLRPHGASHIRCSPCQSPSGRALHLSSP
ncbi:MAG: hypothetical protein IJT77_00655 [Clostridia bacterium]|nr:hypothetical protein [Clostridia bacterium]